MVAYTGHSSHKNVGHFLAFSPEWFAYHQKPLLWLLNGPLKKWFRHVLRVDQTDCSLKSAITEITPKSVTYGTTIGADGKVYRTTDFRTHAKYAKRIYFAFKPLWWALHTWDELLADQFAPGLSFGFSTLTQWPDPGNPGTHTFDSGLYCSLGDSSNFAAVRGNAVATLSNYFETVTEEGFVQLNNSSTTNTAVKLILRSEFLFDTSAIGSGASVSAATFSVASSTFSGSLPSKYNDIGLTPDLALVSSNPASNTQFTTSDYANLGTTDFATRITYAGYSATDGVYNDFAMNTSGKAAVAKTGITKLGLRNGNYDLDNVAPTITAPTGTYFAFRGKYADYAGTTQDPKLVVTYAASGTAYTQNNADIVTVTDAYKFGRTVADSTTVTDATAHSTTTTKADSLSVTDAVSAVITTNGHRWNRGFNYTFAYRMDIPVANPSGIADRSFSVRFPALYLKTTGKILQSSYQDVHITTQDSATELPCQVNADGQHIDFTYASMPVGRTVLHVYYGSATVSAPTTPTLVSVNGNVQAVDANNELSYTDWLTYYDSATGPRTCYAWGADIDFTCITSASPNAKPAGAYSAGYDGTTTTRMLAKYLEGKFPNGTVASARFRAYYNTTFSSAPDSEVYKLHKLQTYGVKNLPDTFSNRLLDHVTWVKSGWSDNARASVPTWNTRMADITSGTGNGDLVAWETAGVFNDAGNICKTVGDEPTLTISAATTNGYVTWNLPTTWIDSWLSDDYSQGVLLKRVNDLAGIHYASFEKTTTATFPVFEVTYSALDPLPFPLAVGDKKRKLTTDYLYAGTATGLDRYVHTPSENDLGVMFLCNSQGGADAFYVAPNGQTCRVQKNMTPPGGFYLNNTTPLMGGYYDAYENRYWLAGNRTDNIVVFAYFDPNGLNNPTWKTSTFTAVKCVVLPKNGVAYFWGGAGGSGSVGYFTYTRATDTFSAVTIVITPAFVGTSRAILAGHDIAATDVMTTASPGVIWADGSVADYAAWGQFIISDGTNTELFFYTGLDLVNNKFTGVTRAECGTTALTLVAGKAITQTGEVTYESMSYDPNLNCLHCTALKNTTLFSYVQPYYLRHYLTDADNVWKTSTGATYTLPVNQKTAQLFGVPGKQNFLENNKLLSNGDLLLAMRHSIHSAISQYDIASFTESSVWRLNSGSTSIVKVSMPTVIGAQIVEIGSTPGKVKITAGEWESDGSFPKALVQVNSADYGNTWDSATRLSTYTFPDPNIGIGGAALCETGNFNGTGLAAPVVGTTYGAVYLQTVVFQLKLLNADTVASSDAVAKLPKKVLADTQTMADAVSTSRILNRFLADTVSMSDATRTVVLKLLADSTVVSDARTKKAYKLLADLQSLADAMTFSKVSTYAIISTPSRLIALQARQNIVSLDRVSSRIVLR